MPAERIACRTPRVKWFSEKRATLRLHGGQQAAAADQTINHLQIAVQRPVAAERADVLAQMAVSGQDALSRSQRLMKLQPLGGTKQLTRQDAAGVRHHHS